jgi:DNA-binding MarR family transcriptional regulator
MPETSLDPKSRRAAVPSAAEPPAEQLLRLIHWTSAASRQLRRLLAEIAAACDLSDSELLVVWLCQAAGRVQVELASAVGVSPAQMSGIVERLRRRGLVAMHRPAGDRRRQVWKTAAAGQALLSQVARPLADLAAGLSQRVESQDQLAALAACERLAARAAELLRCHHDEQPASKEAA